MTILNPIQAADLANDIYLLKQNVNAVGSIIKKPVFGEEYHFLSAHVGGRVINAHTDSFGLIIKGKPNTSFQNDAFLIFRGTVPAANLGADVVTDLRIGLDYSNAGHIVHSGFNQTFTSMIPSIQSFLDTHNITGRVHCVGHSLGGAVATLAAEWISANRSNAVKLYTFGAPKVGFAGFSKNLTDRIKAENICRVYHKTDPVPMIPIYPYVHAPYNVEGYYYPSTEFVALGKAHSMVKYVNNMRGQSWETLSGLAKEPYDKDADIERWIQAEDNVSSKEAGFWRWVNSALAYVIRKAVHGVLVLIQGAAIGIDTIADRIAYILMNNIVVKGIGNLIFKLMRKIARALGITKYNDLTQEELTQNAMKDLLVKLSREAHENARKALKDNESAA